MEPHVLALPKWVPIVRIVQAVLAIIILGTSAYGIYWIQYSSWSFALFCSLATLVIVVYNLLTTFIPACKAAYNYWAVLGLEIFGVIFWLSSMAALAATRATFKYPTQINGCVNYGSGGICYKRSVIQKRDVATNAYLAMMSATAGLSAIEWYVEYPTQP
ncbi:hypothetical protein B0O99DRAFT_226179 [Bisporella sp. PMI_857]|nr:hypothetical protein B0O99DRAFT_226179 [Bisporella sp. PMI_857]